MTGVRNSPARARIAAAFAVLCLGLSLSSCGSSTSTQTKAAVHTSSTANTSQEPAAPTGHMSPKAKKVFEDFVTCMRGHGIDYPALNLSGKGPAVKQTPLDRNTPKFKAARTVCAHALAKALGVGKSETQTS